MPRCLVDPGVVQTGRGTGERAEEYMLFIGGKRPGSIVMKCGWVQA